MRRLTTTLTVAATAGVMLLGTVTTAGAASPVDVAVDICEGAYDIEAPSSEPLAACQWDMAMIGAGDDAWANATGAGVRIGVIDSGVDVDHPDIAPNLDLDASCSFISSDPAKVPADTRFDQEVADGDCSDKDAVVDLDGHGTHVASTIAAPVNGVGIAGVAPEATIVALKACVQSGYCFADAVAAALRHAGDIELDVVNLSLYADPYHFYCKNESEQREILRELQQATRYAQQRGVLVVVAAGNDHWDLQHPPATYAGDPNHPSFGEATERRIGNNCVVAPGELPGVLTVSSVGPGGLADYSTVGMSRVDVAAPGGDYFQATGLVQDAIMAAATDETGDPAEWNALIGPNTFDGVFDPLNPVFPALTVVDDGAPYMLLNGTSMAAPHATGVAALIIENNPGWKPGAVKAAVQRTAVPRPCPAAGDVDFYDDLPCDGTSGRTSYFGHGVVDALAASAV